MNDPTAPSLYDGAPLVATSVAPPLDVDVDGDAVAGTLPHNGVPPWQRDALAISARVRALLATLRPVIVRARTFWDHAVRRVALGAGRSLEVDASGSYRVRSV